MRNICVALLIVLATAVTHAAAPATQRTIEGVVTDVHGHPRQHVNVGKDLDDYRRDVVSDADGRFVIKDAPTTQRTWVAFPASSGKAGLFVAPPPGQSAHVKLQFSVADIDGRVVDTHGRGVKDVRLEIGVRYEGIEYPLETAKTDAGGYFRSSSHSGSGLQLLVKAVDGDRALAALEPVVLKDGQSFVELPDLVLPQPKPEQVAEKDTRRRVGGRVVDEQGQPIAGAKVELQYSYRTMMGVTSSDAQTGADGRWSRRVPADVNSFQLSLQHDRYTSSVFERAFPSPPLEKLIDGSAVSVMKRGLSVHGEVRDEQGKPVDDALILTQRLISSAGGTNEPIEDATMTRSGADGAFVINGIPPGPHEFVVYARDHAPAVVKVVAAADMQPVRATLGAGRDISGIVTDQDDKPMADAKVYVHEWTPATAGSGNHRLPRQATAAATGRFTLRHMPTARTIGLGYVKKGFRHLSDEVPITGEPLTLKLIKPGVVAGRVVDDSTGAPVTSFQLTTGRTDEKGPVFDEHDRWKVNSADGTFKKDVDFGGRTNPLRVIADGYLVLDTTISTSADAAPAEIRLKKGEPYAGVAVDGDGKPVAGAEVAWIGPARQAFIRDGKLQGSYVYRADIVNASFEIGKHYASVYARPADAPKPSGMDSDAGYVASLQPDGRFTIHGLPPGKYTLVAKVHAPPMANSCGIPIAMASAEAAFEVSAKQSLDLPTLPMKAHAVGTAGAPAPPLAGNTLDGKPMSLEQLRGKVVLIDFWASWCAPCTAQIPHVKRLHEKHVVGGKLAVLGVNLDYTAEAGAKFAEREKLPWPSISCAGWGGDNPVLQSFGVTAIPSYWLIGTDGTVLARDVRAADLDAALAEALERR